MKSFLKTIIVSLLLIAMLMPQTAFASNAEITPEWEDVDLTEEEFNEILANNPNNNISTCASGLVVSYSMAISKDGDDLLVAGYTNCIMDVVKCGFKKLIIQKRKNSSSSWADYRTYTELYIDSDYYHLAKRITVPTGYQYRVTCIHYAKKNIFSTQKINNISNAIII